MDNIDDIITQGYTEATDKAAYCNHIRALLATLDGDKNPVMAIRKVPIDKVHANDYNPNSVATQEMRLLHTSISHDGYTQPVVTVYDPDKDRYVIVDGFHRYTIMRTCEDVRAANAGMLPVVVIDKPLADRMASTVRHNRARGKHAITGMSNIVFSLLDQGLTNGQICKELGLEAEELAKLKHITGFSKLFENEEYLKAWETKRQIQIRKEYEQITTSNQTSVS